MTRKPAVMIYHSILPQVEMLSKAEAGELLCAFLHYSMTGSYDPLPYPAELIMRGCVPLIDRDNEKYAYLCERRREAAVSRWQKAHPGEQPNLALLGEAPSRADVEAFVDGALG